jgi:hypothetical protein
MMEVRLLRLGLADRLCSAPDYGDQAHAINEKSSALSELADLGEKGLLPPEQAAMVKLQQQEHRQRFASFPCTLSTISISTKGLVFVRYPEFVAVHEMGPPGTPRLIVSAFGSAGFGF